MLAPVGHGHPLRDALFCDEEFGHGPRDLVDFDVLLRHFGRTRCSGQRWCRAHVALQLDRPLYYALRWIGPHSPHAGPRLKSRRRRSHAPARPLRQVDESHCSRPRCGQRRRAPRRAGRAARFTSADTGSRCRRTSSPGTSPLKRSAATRASQGAAKTWDAPRSCELENVVRPGFIRFCYRPALALFSSASRCDAGMA